MKASRGEIKIHEILEEEGLVFQEEYSFHDLVSSTGRPLRFDFAVFDDGGDLDYLIEFQGSQHYEPKRNFGGHAGFVKQKTNDDKKRIYCKRHGYTLIEIPFWDENKISYEYILSALYSM